MTDYLKHATKPTGVASDTVWQETTLHQLQNQAAGDILYAADGTHLARLPIGTTNYALTVVGGVPVWTPISTPIHAASAKGSFADNDEIPIIDSAASNVLKKNLWSVVKSELKTYFDTLYQAK